MISGIRKVVVPVDDQERAKQFWTRDVGFELRRDDAYGDERWIEVAPPEGTPVLVLSPRPAGEPRPAVPDELPHSPLFFTCRDIEATYRDLSRRGVAFPAPPRQQHFGWWSLFEDPDGTRYALGQWDAAPSPEAPLPDGDLVRLDVLVGRWRTPGRTHEDEAIDAVDTYEWLPGRFALLHRVDARVGDRTVEGAEIIGYDPAGGVYMTQYFGSDGPARYEATLDDERGLLIWRMRSDGDQFTGAFSPDGARIEGHWERLDDTGWQPWMDVTLTKER